MARRNRLRDLRVNSSMAPLTGNSFGAVCFSIARRKVIRPPPATTSSSLSVWYGLWINPGRQPPSSRRTLRAHPAGEGCAVALRMKSRFPVKC